MAGAQGGTLNNFRVVRYGATARPWVVATLPMSDRRPPAGLVGIPSVFYWVVTPTLLATELGGVQKADLV